MFSLFEFIIASFTQLELYLLSYKHIIIIMLQLKSLILCPMIRIQTNESYIFDTYIILFHGTLEKS
jgi:hypothetical protein